MRAVARRVRDIEPFRVVEVLTRARELEQAGRSILHLEAGEPDFRTALPIIRAGQAALERGDTYYSQAGGLPQLREAVSQWYAQEYGLAISPRRILITPGASGALLLLSALLVNPGDGVLMADPGYPCNRVFLRTVEGEAQLVPVTAEHRYQLLPELAEAHWRENTTGMLVASPANPTGEILHRQELQGLVDLSRRRDGFLIVDEIYHGLTYGVDAPSVLSISDEAFVINSFSKYFGMTGWRLGWLVAPEALAPELEKLAQNYFISMSTMAQFAALAAFEPETRHILDERRDIFAARRDFLLPQLQRLGFGIAKPPDGALYIYADSSRFSDDSQRFCLDLLEQHGVAVTPGLDFGRYRAREHVRFAYTTGMDALEEAVQRLEKVLG